MRATLVHQVPRIFLTGAALTMLPWSALHAQSLKTGDVRIKDTFIVVETVEVPADGWLVAHRGESPTGVKPGEIIGAAPVKAGANKDVQLPAPETLQPGSAIILMLHKDAGMVGSFSEADDKPVMAGEKPVMEEVKVK
jgi:hypothetical protein